MVRALQEWRHYLHGSKHPITAVTDHKSLEYLPTQDHLTPRQARWVEFLQDFDLRIKYRSGNQNQAADALSRRSDHEDQVALSIKEGKGKDDPRVSVISCIEDLSMLAEIREAGRSDLSYQEMLDKPRSMGSR